MSELLAGALLAGSWSDGFGLSGATPSQSGFAKMTNNATRAANTPTSAIRPISANTSSARRTGGSGMGSGHKANSDLVRRF